MRRTLVTAALTLGFAAILACVGPAPKPAVVDSCDYVYGACVLYTPEAPRLAHQRIEQAFERAALHWGTKPTALTGWTVVVHGYGPQPVAGGFLWGITLVDRSRVDYWIEYPTCPEAVFVHEWGHASDWAAGGSGIPHLPGVPDDARYDDAAILKTLAGLKGC